MKYILIILFTIGSSSCYAQVDNVNESVEFATVGLGYENDQGVWTIYLLYVPDFMRSMWEFSVTDIHKFRDEREYNMPIKEQEIIDIALNFSEQIPQELINFAERLTEITCEECDSSELIFFSFSNINATSLTDIDRDYIFDLSSPDLTKEMRGFGLLIKKTTKELETLAKKTKE